MKLTSAHKTVSALVYTLVEIHLEGRCMAAPTDCNRVAAFVGEQARRMPDYLRWPIWVLTIGFDLWGLVTAGTRFHKLPPASRARQVTRCRNSRFGPCRDLVLFYETLTVFGVLSLPGGTHGR